MIRRPQRYTQSRSSAASDVYKRQLRAQKPDQEEGCDREDRGHGYGYPIQVLLDDVRTCEYRAPRTAQNAGYTPALTCVEEHCQDEPQGDDYVYTVSYTHLRAHE